MRHYRWRLGIITQAYKCSISSLNRFLISNTYNELSLATEGACVQLHRLPFRYNAEAQELEFSVTSRELRSMQNCDGAHCPTHVFVIPRERHRGEIPSRSGASQWGSLSGCVQDTGRRPSASSEAPSFPHKSSHISLAVWGLRRGLSMW